MKKVIATAVIACMVMMAQAGSVKWGTVGMYNASEALVKNTATLYVYMLDQETYDGITDVWATYGDNVKAGGTTASNVGGTKTSSYGSKATFDSPKNTATANTTYYAAVIATFGTGDDMMYYAQKASVTTGDDGNASYQLGLGVLDSAASAKSAWQPATDVPEPTSGLLLLVGGALLALRRKQK